MKKEAASESPVALVLRFVRKEGPWEKKPLLEAVFWVKMILALVAGIALGVFRITGAIGNLVFIAVCGFAIQLYVTSVMGIDVDELLGNASSVLAEGALPCYAAFLLCWTMFNTLFSA